MDIERIAELFKSHLNPGQYHFMKLLGFHKIKIESAKGGAFYTDQNGCEILDFFLAASAHWRWVTITQG